MRESDDEAQTYYDETVPITPYFGQVERGPLELICPVTGENLLDDQGNGIAVMVLKGTVGARHVTQVYWVTKHSNQPAGPRTREYQEERRGPNSEMWRDIRALCNPLECLVWYGGCFEKTALGEMTWEPHAWENMKYLMCATLQYAFREPTHLEAERAKAEGAMIEGYDRADGLP